MELLIMSFTFAFAVAQSDSSHTVQIVPVTVSQNCIKYAEQTLKSVDASVKILPDLSRTVGKNLHKMEEKEPGSRLRAVANAYSQTFA